MIYDPKEQITFRKTTRQGGSVLSYDFAAIGERIKLVRSAAGLNKTEFAESLEVTHSHVSKVESGMRASDLFLKCVALQFGVSLTWLKTGEGSMRESPPSHAGEAMPSFGDGAFQELVAPLWEFWSKADADERTWLKVELRQKLPGIYGELKKATRAIG